jgi:membrane associated rhomboid family serine protease
MMAIGAPGVGWLAHLSGFIAGTVIGLTFRYAPGLSQGA